MEIIGISGKAGSGKDYVGKLVLEPLGYKKWALAWPMKNEALGESRNWTHEMVHETKPDAVRTWLQKRGTEDGWMKHDQDYWLRIALGWMTTMEKEWGQKKFYIPDVRFVHEVTYIQQVMGGKVIRLFGNRPNRLTPEQSAHVSETALDDFNAFDGVVWNGGQTTLAELRAEFAVLGILEKATLTPTRDLRQMYWKELYDLEARADG